MNQIKLTDRQSKRLIKMCMNLFVSDIKPHIDNNNNIVVWNLAKDVNAEYATSIHWFEFCMRYLTSKLDLLYFEKIMNPLDPFHVSNKNKNLEYPENWKELWENRPFEKFNKICNGSEYKKHPIDYLYEQFKQLK